MHERVLESIGYCEYVKYIVCVTKIDKVIQKFTLLRAGSYRSDGWTRLVFWCFCIGASAMDMTPSVCPICPYRASTCL